MGANTFRNMFTLPRPPMPDVPPAATPPTLADPSVAAIGARARARLAALGGMGFGGTVKTSSQGAQAPEVTKAILSGGKTLA